MYEIPHSKILILGGELKEKAKVQFYTHGSDYAETRVVKGGIQLSVPGTGAEFWFTGIDIDSYRLDYKIPFSLIFQSALKGKAWSDAVIDLAFEEALFGLEFNLTQLHRGFIECAVALRIRGTRIITREAYDDPALHEFWFKIRKK